MPCSAWHSACFSYVWKPKRSVSAHESCKPASRDIAAAIGPDKWWQPASPSEREQEGNKAELSSVMKIFKENNIGRDMLGFQERQTVISKCFLASSGYLTKAAGEFHWRIRLVAFLWLLMSGDFGLCLESQWSNRRVFLWSRLLIVVKQTMLFFFLKRGLFMLWSIILHLWLQCDVLHCCHHFGSAAEECTWGFPWAHGRKLTCFFNILKSHQWSFPIYHCTGFIRIGPQIF